MNIKELSDRDILCLQYSILEELKQKKNNNAQTINATIEQSSDLSIDEVLSNSFKDENRSEKANGRMTPSAKKIIDNSKYSYGDAIEYFAKVLESNNTSVSKKPYEQFILERFEDGLGNVENDVEYYCRVSWFDNSCPTYKELSKIIGYTPQRIGNYASKYNWSNIKQTAFDLGYRLGNNPRIIKENFVDNSNNEVERNSKEYHRYHERVLKRDKVCQCCGSKEDLEVHHPMPFNQYNSLGADTNNGIVLCKECHSKYHTEYGYKRNANAVTLALFLRDYGMNPQTSLDATIPPIEDKLYTYIKSVEEDCETECKISKLISDYQTRGFTESEIREGLTKLINKGLVYTPSKGYVKVV